MRATVKSSHWIDRNKLYHFSAKIILNCLLKPLAITWQNYVSVKYVLYVFKTVPFEKCQIQGFICAFLCSLIAVTTVLFIDSLLFSESGTAAVSRDWTFKFCLESSTVWTVSLFLRQPHQCPFNFTAQTHKDNQTRRFVFMFCERTPLDLCGDEFCLNLWF